MEGSDGGREGMKVQQGVNAMQMSHYGYANVWPPRVMRMADGRCWREIYIPH